MIPMKTVAALGDEVGRARAAGLYGVNEVFASLQGEGTLSGTPMLFVRLARCNLRCASHNLAGFDCDTDFDGARLLSLDALIVELRELEKTSGRTRWVLLTGGEPALQVDEPLLVALKGEGWSIAMESNGTVAMASPLRALVDHLTVSPKSAPHTLRLRDPDELRVVRARGQELSPYPTISARFKFVSPAFDATGRIDPATLAWCIDLVARAALDDWRLSVQQHKLWGAR